MIREFIETIRLKLHGIELLEVNDKIIQAFRKQVKNNKNSTDEEIIKKINRNWILAKDTEEVEYCEGFKVYIRHYGNLEIGVLPEKESGFKKDLVYYIYNKKGKKLDFNIDEKLKTKLNKIMRL